MNKKYRSLEHIINDLQNQWARQKIEAVPREHPEKDREDVDEVGRPDEKRGETFVRQQEIQKKIIDERHTSQQAGEAAVKHKKAAVDLMIKGNAEKDRNKATKILRKSARHDRAANVAADLETKSEEVNKLGESAKAPKDREVGTKKLVKAYAEDTPGEKKVNEGAAASKMSKINVKCPKCEGKRKSIGCTRCEGKGLIAGKESPHTAINKQNTGWRSAMAWIKGDGLKENLNELSIDKMKKHKKAAHKDIMDTEKRFRQYVINKNDTAANSAVKRQDKRFAGIDLANKKIADKKYPLGENRGLGVELKPSARQVTKKRGKMDDDPPPGPKKNKVVINPPMNNDKPEDQKPMSEGEQGDLIRSKVPRKDMMGKKCGKCKKGTYGETSIQDDWHGNLHCSNCGHETRRHQIKSHKGKWMAEGDLGAEGILNRRYKKAKRDTVMKHGGPWGFKKSKIKDTEEKRSFEFHSAQVSDHAKGKKRAWEKVLEKQRSLKARQREKNPLRNIA